MNENERQFCQESSETVINFISVYEMENFINFMSFISCQYIKTETLLRQNVWKAKTGAKQLSMHKVFHDLSGVRVWIIIEFEQDWRNLRKCLHSVQLILEMLK